MEESFDNYMKDQDISLIHGNKTRGKSIDHYLVDIFAITVDGKTKENIAKSLEEKLSLSGDKEHDKLNKSTNASEKNNLINTSLVHSNKSNIRNNTTVNSNIGLKK